jgi:hypothetical protein
MPRTQEVQQGENRRAGCQHRAVTCHQARWAYLRQGMVTLWRYVSLHKWGRSRNRTQTLTCDHHGWAPATAHPLTSASSLQAARGPSAASHPGPAVSACVTLLKALCRRDCCAPCAASHAATRIPQRPSSWCSSAWALPATSPAAPAAACLRGGDRQHGAVKIPSVKLHGARSHAPKASCCRGVDRACLHEMFRPNKSWPVLSVTSQVSLTALWQGEETPVSTRVCAKGEASRKLAAQDAAQGRHT